MSAENFSNIVRKARVKELIPFLQSLDKNGRKEIATALPILSKELLEFREERSIGGGITYKQKATPEQVTMLYASGFVCMNRRDYQRLDRFNHLLSNDMIHAILPWYCPDWFSTLINDSVNRQGVPWNFTYKVAMDMTEKGYLQPSDELIVRLLPQAIFERHADFKDRYAPHNLLKFEDTLKRHIWLIFQFETTINFSERFHQSDSGSPSAPWMYTLKALAEEGRLARHRLLSECLLTSCRNFNKGLTGWFAELFVFLKPSPAELLQLQSELLSAAGSPHTKAVNTALTAFKAIVQDNAFNHRGFLEIVPVLLSSETKTVVGSTLLLMEKLAKKHPALLDEIGMAACHAFIHNDENLQKKAVRILVHKGAVSGAVANEIRKFWESMLMSSRNALNEYIAEPAQAAPVSTGAQARISDADNIGEVQKIRTVDELIFLASQAFENNDPMHLELLPAAMVNLQHQLTGEVLPKFEPALQRAYTLLIKGWSSSMGFLDHLAATFFIETTRLFAARYPAEGASLDAIHQDVYQKEQENKAKWSWYEIRIPELTGWYPASEDNTYIIFKSIMLLAYNKLKEQQGTPILSTPTHTCGYIDPLVLVQRLAMYKASNAPTEDIDFQLAISRVGPFNHAEAIRQAREVLDGEILRILEFLLLPDATPVPPFTIPTLWYIAGVTKEPRKKNPLLGNLFYASLLGTLFTGDVQWRSFEEHFVSKRYNYQSRKEETFPDKRNVLRLSMPPMPSIWQRPQEPADGLLKKIIRILGPSGKPVRKESYLLYEYFSFKAKYISVEHNDIQRIIYLVPSNPDPVLAHITSRALVYSTLSGDSEKRLVIATLEALNILGVRFSVVTCLFIGSCLLTSDKTVRSYAAELWLKAVPGDKTIATEVGRVIGVHLSGGYAPLKRLTDVITENLMRVSADHNEALEELLTNIVGNAPNEPPTGSKRLLEIYAEVISINGSSVKSGEAKEKLQRWGEAQGLKKIVASMMQS